MQRYLIGARAALLAVLELIRAHRRVNRRRARRRGPPPALPPMPPMPGGLPPLPLTLVFAPWRDRHQNGRTLRVKATQRSASSWAAEAVRKDTKPNPQRAAVWRLRCRSLGAPSRRPSRGARAQHWRCVTSPYPSAARPSPATVAVSAPSTDAPTPAAPMPPASPPSAAPEIASRRAGPHCPAGRPPHRLGRCAARRASPSSDRPPRRGRSTAAAPLEA